MEELLDTIRGLEGPWALIAVFAAAALEYMMPPLPADSIVLAGALLVIAGRHSFVTVYVIAVAGGMVGAFAHYWIGQRITRGGEFRGQRFIERMTGEGSIERFFEAFRRYGMKVVVFNRAMPGVRAVTFLAAGMAGLPLGRTMLAGLVSHAMWTAAILTLGVQVGESWEKIEAVFTVYQRVVYAVAGAALVAYVGYRLWRRRQGAPPPGTKPS